MLERHQDELATAALVFHELRYGCLRMPTSRKRELIEAFLERVLWGNLDILPYDALAAEWHAEERVRLSLKRRPPSFVDGQIAAIARVHGLILVTRNTADFAVFEGIKVQNWHAAACGTPEPDE
ncbi:MAG: type II toxin-antitoxin system VapC family toxin [Desulfobacteraceae bacterium]